MSAINDMAATSVVQGHLPANSRETVAGALNGLLADAFTLYIKTKNFHWHVSGPHFHDYHLLFDAQAAQILAATDQIAERVRKTGHPTLRSIGDILWRRILADNDQDHVDAVAMLRELRNDNVLMVTALHRLKELADDANDNATSALVDDWTDQAEERAWFLFEAGEAK